MTSFRVTVAGGVKIGRAVPKLRTAMLAALEALPRTGKVYVWNGDEPLLPVILAYDEAKVVLSWDGRRPEWVTQAEGIVKANRHLARRR